MRHDEVVEEEVDKDEDGDDDEDEDEDEDDDDSDDDDGIEEVEAEPDHQVAPSVSTSATPSAPSATSMTCSMLRAELLAKGGSSWVPGMSAKKAKLVELVLRLRSGAAAPVAATRGRKAGTTSKKKTRKGGPRASGGLNPNVVMCTSQDPRLVTIAEFNAEVIDEPSRAQMVELSARFASLREQRATGDTAVALFEKCIGPFLGIVRAYSAEAPMSELTLSMILNAYGVTLRMMRFRGALPLRFQRALPVGLDYATWTRIIGALTAFNPDATSFGPQRGTRGVRREPTPTRRPCRRGRSPPV